MGNERAPSQVQSYALNTTRIIAAGIAATAAMTLMMYYGPPMVGMPPGDIGTILGTMLLPNNPGQALWIGLIMHLANGIIFAAIYAAVLLSLRQQSGGGTGAIFGVLLWLIEPMLLLPIILTMHPLVKTGRISHPGFFSLNLGMGWTPAAFSLATHLVYGVLVGLFYKHPVRFHGPYHERFTR